MSERFAQRLKREREALGWTQQYMAGLLGITNGTISGYERNYREPDIDTLVRIAVLLGTSVDYLVGKSDRKNDGSLASSCLHDSHCPYHVAETLPEEAQRTIEEFIGFIINKFNGG